jgi:hypothetical protein
MPFFPFLGLTDAVLFGLGATFLVFGLPEGDVPLDRLPYGLLLATPEHARE